MVDAQDFTYSKGYLGLLSTLGATLGIIFCCAPPAYRGFLMLWEVCLKRTPTAVRIDEENATTDPETPKILSHAMINVKATQTYNKSARWSMDQCIDGAKPPPYGELKRHCTF